jgi:hypothetical protein
MKVVLANRICETDGSMHSMASQINSKLPIVLVSRPNQYKFNEQLLSLTDYVLIDCCEYGHDIDFDETHLFGKNTEEKFFSGDEWKRFDDWVAKTPPKLYLKRELLAKDVSDIVKPIEYAAWYEPPPIQSKSEFDARPLDVFFSWGYSSEYRRQLHGKIWTDAHKYGYMVCDNLFYLNGFLQHETNPKKWVTVNVPHFARHPMNEIFGVQGLAKISISHWGAGKKCFRSAEAPLNAVMCMPKDNYAWTHEWKHDKNCVLFDNKEPMLMIAAAAMSNDLYDIYVNGVETCRKYYLPNYINHLEKLINGI